MYTNVIVRAYGNEPVIMSLSVGEHGEALIGRPNGTEQIPYPKEYVYKADARLFAMLRSAFDENDTGALSELWAKAVQIDAALIS